MKKIKLLSSLMLMVLGVIGLGACSDDNGSNPTVGTTVLEPVVLNQPAVVNEHIQLSAANTVNMSWSQTNYGFVALATYKIQVGLVQGDGSITWYQKANDAGVMENQFLETTYTKCSADLNGEEIAWAINGLHGYTTKSQYVDNGFEKIAFRVYSCILDGQNNEVDNTGVFSNAITFPFMAAYNAIKEKGWIYVVGDITPDGAWIAPSEDNADALEPYKLLETEVGNKIYQGTFDISAGTHSFRFFTKLIGWSADYSVGPTEADFSSAELKFNEEQDVLNNALGNFALNDFAGGKIKMTVNLNTMKAKFEEVTE